MTDKIKPPARAFLVEKLWKKIVLLLILLPPAPPNAFLSVLAPRALHPGLGMETFGGNAFIGDLVQVGDAFLALFIDWCELNMDRMKV